MEVIKSHKDLEKVKLGRMMKDSQMAFIEGFFRQLFEASGEESIKDFLLGDQATIKILGPEEMPWDCIEGPIEFVEIEILSDKSRIFKIATMLDNDVMEFYLGEVNQQNKQLMDWLNEYVY